MGELLTAPAREQRRFAAVLIDIAEFIRTLPEEYQPKAFELLLELGDARRSERLEDAR